MKKITTHTMYHRRTVLGGLGFSLMLVGCGSLNNVAKSRSRSAPGTTKFSSPADSESVSASTESSSNIYKWPTYTSVPRDSYDFEIEDNPNLEVRTDRGGVDRRITSGYIALAIGPDPNEALTDDMIETLLERLNADLKIALEDMGFAPDKGFSRGFYLNYYLIGSGLEDDDLPKDQETGYQGAWQFEGEIWPCISTSYHAIARAYDGDELARSNITHEMIHVLQTGTGNFFNAGWFHEAHNAQFVARLVDRRDGQKRLGYLDSISSLGPHIPIEAFAGWMKDGTFGGPNPDYENADPRDLFGGAQYCGTFPLFLHICVGSRLNNWLWKNNRTDSETVLQTLERGIGKEATQRAIMEYRARIASLDFGEWRDALREQVIEEFNDETVRYTYAKTSQDGNVLTPAEETLPGTSGANYIPLSVGDGSSVSISFMPSDENMRCQLVYRTDDNNVVYSHPVERGKCVITLDKTPNQNTVIAVITNVDIIHSETKKFHYQIELGNNLEVADRSTAYF